MKQKTKAGILLLLAAVALITGCGKQYTKEADSYGKISARIAGEAAIDVEKKETPCPETAETKTPAMQVQDTHKPDSHTVSSMLDVPAYNGNPYVEINNNIPSFTDTEKITKDIFETYSELDGKGRCGTAYANICKKLMPDEDRKEISHVEPSGWNNKPYDFIDGGYIYNRCHLIGFQLAGENANEKNLVTGTRYMNVDGMLPFENEVASYVKNTGNHVLYRVTPVYEKDNLVVSGIQMEAYSIEDSGKGVQFNIYCYNVQPGCTINYADGDNWEAGEENNDVAVTDDVKYILNTNSRKFHKTGCRAAEVISGNNKKSCSGTRDALIQDGYSPCGICKP